VKIRPGEFHLEIPLQFSATIPQFRVHEVQIVDCVNASYDVTDKIA